MKILKFKDFVKLPVGTIFSYYDPAIFFGLWRKEETLYCKQVHPDDCPDGATDYFQQSLLPQEDLNGEITIGGIERWGEYSWDQQYAVYEEEDIILLKKLLEKSY